MWQRHSRWLVVYRMMNKMNYPLVAIVIPTLNEALFIGPCLDSILGQNYPFNRLDIMVVDGGSDDKTHEIVNGYADKWSNIRWIDNPRKIQSAAFNIGVSRSSASIVVRMDAHARYASDYISKCVAKLSTNPELGNVGGVCKVEAGAPTLMGKANAVLNQTSFGIGGAAFRIGTKACFTDTVPFGAFPRKVLDEIGPMNEKLSRGEDNEYNARVRNAGYKIYFDPEIISTYYSRPTLTSSVHQMYRNGRSIGVLLRTFPRAVGLRHVVPACFVVGMLSCLLFGWWVPILWNVLIWILVVYWIAALGATGLACLRFGFDMGFILPILFFSVHIAYGTGTVYGFLTKKI